MLCEKCKKRTATVFYNENINGQTSSYSLCGECAAKLREKGDLGDVTSMIGSFADPYSALHNDLFGGFVGIPGLKTIPTAKRCPDCGASYADIRENGKVGCPSCYAAFQNELRSTIASIHGTTTHVGGVPSRHRAKQARVELQEAIANEDYERAAGLRDEIRKLQSDDEKKGE